jgi:hypothetical protein
LKTVYIATKKSEAQGYFLQMFDNPPFPHQSAQTPAAPAAKPSTILDLTLVPLPGAFVLVSVDGMCFTLVKHWRWRLELIR